MHVMRDKGSQSNLKNLIEHSSNDIICIGLWLLSHWFGGELLNSSAFSQIHDSLEVFKLALLPLYLQLIWIKLLFDPQNCQKLGGGNVSDLILWQPAGLISHSAALYVCHS